MDKKLQRTILEYIKKSRGVTRWRIARARFFSKSLPRHQFCRILLFQKTEPKADLLSKLSIIAFFFQNWCLGGKENFLFWIFACPPLAGESKKAEAEQFKVFSFCTFGRHRPTQPNVGDSKEFPKF